MAGIVSGERMISIIILISLAAPGEKVPLRGCMDIRNIPYGYRVVDYQIELMEI